MMHCDIRRNLIKSPLGVIIEILVTPAGIDGFCCFKAQNAGKDVANHENVSNKAP